MHFVPPPAWLAVALLLAACSPPAPTTAPAPSPSPASNRPAAATSPGPLPGRIEAWLNDGQPQAGLPRIKVYLGAHELNTELALTTEAIQKGMMWRTQVQENDAMLFVFGRTHQTSFWMKNVPMDIDVAYIDPEGVIQEIHRLQQQNTNPVPSRADNIQYALETAPGWFQRKGVGEGAVLRTDRGSLQDTFFPRQPQR